MVIVKLDFKKAFDKVEHELITQVMQHKGFGPKWEKWIKMIMESCTSNFMGM
jgi:hypothetical protein